MKKALASFLSATVVALVAITGGCDSKPAADSTKPGGAAPTTQAQKLPDPVN